MEQAAKTFVEKVQADTRATARQRNAQGQLVIPEAIGLGFEMGTKYAAEYRDLSKKYTGFETKCNYFLTIGQAWERFYWEFMTGVLTSDFAEVVKDDVSRTAKVRNATGRLESAEIIALGVEMGKKHTVMYRRLSSTYSKFPDAFAHVWEDSDVWAAFYHEFMRGLNSA